MQFETIIGLQLIMISGDVFLDILTISLKLLKNYPFVGYEINLIAILMSVIIFFILSFCAPCITLDNKLKFLSLQNIGNILGYIGLFISMFDSSFNSKKSYKPYRKNKT